MKIVNAYIGEGQFCHVQLSEEIDTCANIPETDINKLDALLADAKSKMNNVMGIYVYSEGRIVLFDNGAFSCKVWVLHSPIKGEWEPYQL